MESSASQLSRYALTDRHRIALAAARHGLCARPPARDVDLELGLVGVAVSRHLHLALYNRSPAHAAAARRCAVDRQRQACVFFRRPVHAVCRVGIAHRYRRRATFLGAYGAAYVATICSPAVACVGAPADRFYVGFSLASTPITRMDMGPPRIQTAVRAGYESRGRLAPVQIGRAHV